MTTPRRTVVSVLITARNESIEHITKTIKSIREKSIDGIEVLLMLDGGENIVLPEWNNVKVFHNETPQGRRVSYNKLAKEAEGDYLFFLDAHCSMTQDWDVKLVNSIGANDIVYCVIQDIFPDTWEYRPGRYSFVSLNRNLVEKWWDKKPLDKCEPVEQSIAFTGCAWLIRKDRYWQLGGYDESLGEYGYDGPEWALKTQLSEPTGKVLLRTDVICGHVFGTNNGSKLYPVSIMSQDKWREKMLATYGRQRIENLIHSFGEVPSWDNSEKSLSKRAVNIDKNDTTITKDKDGNIIKQVVKHYRYIYTDDGSGPPEEELAKTYGPKAVYIGESVFIPNLKGEMVKQEC